MSKRVRNILVAAAIVLAAAVAFAAWYVNDYYHAQGVDGALASSDTVTVATIENGWMFDGPGTDNALVFYPGAKVEASAYAPLMHDLAEAGIDCFLVEMPFNLALFGIDAAALIICDPAYEAYKFWHLAGHSLGGAMASSFTARNPELIDGLVLLAAYPTNSLQAAGTPILSIYGSEDGVLNLGKVAEGHSLVDPAAYTEVVLDGGNHAQFGSYGTQAGDGSARISAEEQRAQTVAAIVAFVQP